MNGHPEYVLDSTALLAILFSEPGRERVIAVLTNSAISAVNVTEAANKLIHRGAQPNEAEEIIRALNLDIRDWTAAMAYQSGEFADFGRSHGISLGDRACLTLAKTLHATAITSDRDWRHLHGLGVKLLMFR